MVSANMVGVDSATTFGVALEAARRGDAEALGLLAERFYPTVQRLVHRRLELDLRASRPWLATRFSTGDVVQEVFLGVLKDLSAFAGDNEGAFVGYLAIVVRNRIIDAVRFHEADRRDGRRAGPSADQLDLAGPGGDPTAELGTVEQRDRLHEVLKTFPPREQLLLRARLENLATFRELAEQLGYHTESGARRAYYAAHARLALALKGLG